MEELFNGQLSFADIDAEKFLHVRRAHADRRVNAMDRLTDDVINELIQLCLPHYHIKAGETVQQGRPYTRLETMLRVHLLQVSLNLSDPEMESYLASDMVARNFCRVSSTRLFISYSTILRFRHFIEQHGLAQKFLERQQRPEPVLLIWWRLTAPLSKRRRQRRTRLTLEILRWLRDAFQHLVKSHSFKQICFPHRSEMGVLKSFLGLSRKPPKINFRS